MANFGVATAGYGFKVSSWAVMAVAGILVYFGYQLRDQKEKRA